MPRLCGTILQSLELLFKVDIPTQIPGCEEKRVLYLLLASSFVLPREAFEGIKSLPSMEGLRLSEDSSCQRLSGESISDDSKIVSCSKTNGLN
jgi:hypothetical protein